MADDFEQGAGLGFLVGGLIALIICVFSMGSCDGDGVRTEAVRRGHAHWNVSPEGKTTFEWNGK